MDRLYLLPIQEITDERGYQRGPLYIKWRDDLTGLDGYAWSMMDYGFAPFGLVIIKDISQQDHDTLVANSDVYEWPELDNLDDAIAPADNLDEFFEAIGIPTDWLQPGNTYLEFLRQSAAMFQFNQKYGGIAAHESGEFHSLIDDAGGLDARYLTWSQQTQDWFDATLVWFGYPAVSGNPSLRQLMKQAGDLWGTKPFYLGGHEF